MDPAVDDQDPRHGQTTRCLTHPALRDETEEHEGDPQSERDGTDVSGQAECGYVDRDGSGASGRGDGGECLWDGRAGG